jgi:chromosome segregation ATPase
MNGFPDKKMKRLEIWEAQKKPLVRFTIMRSAKTKPIKMQHVSAHLVGDFATCSPPTESSSPPPDSLPPLTVTFSPPRSPVVTQQLQQRDYSLTEDEKVFLEQLRDFYEQMGEHNCRDEEYQETIAKLATCSLTLLETGGRISAYQHALDDRDEKCKQILTQPILDHQHDRAEVEKAEEDVQYCQKKAAEEPTADVTEGLAEAICQVESLKSANFLEERDLQTQEMQLDVMKKEIEALEQEIRLLQDDPGLTIEINFAVALPTESDIPRPQGRKQEVERRRRELDSGKAKLGEDTEAWTTECQRCEDRGDELRQKGDELRELQRQIEQGRLEFDSLAMTTVELETEKEELSHKIEHLLRQLRAQKVATEDRRQQLIETLKENDKKRLLIEQKRSELERRKDDLKGTESEIEQARIEIGELEKSVASFDQERSSVEAELRALQERVGSGAVSTEEGEPTAEPESQPADEPG